MWVYLILGVIAIFIISFLSSLSKDKKELEYLDLDAKFFQFVYKLNDYAFGGKGHIKYNNYLKGLDGSVKKDNRRFHLYETDSNQIILFDYSTGHLTVTWKYKYFNHEVSHEKQFRNVRHTTDLDQLNMAKALISEMEIVIQNHKNRVNSYG